MMALLEQGADPDEEMVDGWRLVHYLAKVGKTQMLKVLLESGADPDPQKEDGWTPMMLAVFNDQFDAAKLLVKTANFEVKNAQGCSCEDLAEAQDRCNGEEPRYSELLLREKALREKAALAGAVHLPPAPNKRRPGV